MSDIPAQLSEPMTLMRTKDVKHLADRIKELEAELKAVTALRELMSNMWGMAEDKLAKAIEALDEAIYLLDPDDEDIAKETGLHRIVTTLAQLKGEDRV